MSKKLSKAVYVDSYLRKGSFILWNDRVYIINDYDLNQFTIDVIDHETGTASKWDFFEVFHDPSPGKEHVFANTLEELFQKDRAIQQKAGDINILSETGISKSLLKKAQLVIDVVETVDRAIKIAIELARLDNKKVKVTPIIKDCLARLPEPVSITTYYDYRARYKTNNGVRAPIARSYTTARHHKTQKPPALLHLVDLLLERYYFQKKGLRHSRKSIFERLKRILSHTGGLWIDPKKCRSVVPEDLMSELLRLDRSFDFIARNPEKMALLSSAGSISRSWFYDHFKVLQQEYDQPDDHARTAFLRLGHRTQIPLDLQYMDEWQLSIYREYRGVRERLIDIWITWVLEGYARCITGFWVHAGAPDLGVGLSALKHSIFPKDLKGILGYPMPMPFGIHKSISLDNALMHDSTAYDNVAKMLSAGGQFPRMEFIFRPKGQPKYGGTIESGIGTFAHAFHDAMDEIVVFVEDLGTTNVNKQARQIVDYITRKAYQLIGEYHHTRHSVLGQCPIDCWNEAINETRGIPLVPHWTDRIDRMFWAPFPGDRILKDGRISLNGMHYVPLGISEKQDELQRLDPQGKINHFGIHFSPQNIGRIAVFSHGEWIDDCVALELLGPDGKTLNTVSKLERKIAQTLAKKAGESSSEWISFLEATDDRPREVEATPVQPMVRLQNKTQGEDNNDFHSDQYWENASGYLSNLNPSTED